jgi:hypothetical protein
MTLDTTTSNLKNNEKSLNKSLNDISKCASIKDVDISDIESILKKKGKRKHKNSHV